MIRSSSALSTLCRPSRRRLDFRLRRDPTRCLQPGNLLSVRIYYLLRIKHPSYSIRTVKVDSPLALVQNVGLIIGIFANSFLVDRYGSMFTQKEFAHL